MNKKLILSAVIASVLPIAVYANTGVTLEQAKETATKQVPNGSTLIKANEENSKYELKFYNETKQEKYEIDVAKDTGKIVEYETQLNNDKGNNTINLKESDVKNIVLSEIPHATITSIELVTDDKLKEYKVSFKTDSGNGYMEINPNTGNILERKFKWYQSQISSDKNYITIDKVKQIANEKVPNGIITDIDFNTHTYEVEIYKDNYEYDLILNAVTGEQIALTSELDNWDYEKSHLKWDYDEFDYHSFFGSKIDTNNSSSAMIGLDKAKEIALQKVPNASITTIKLDEDDGRVAYEGKMYKDNIEYEFEIDAYSGKIIDWDQEYDD